MSTLTKVLIVLLTVFSIFLCGIVVTYVANADHYREIATKNKRDYDSARQMRRQAEEKLDDADKEHQIAKDDWAAQRTELENSVNSLTTELEKVKRDNAKLVLDVANANTTVKKSTEIQEKQMAQAQSAQQEVKTLQAEQTRLSKELAETDQILNEKMAIIQQFDEKNRQLMEANQALEERLNEYLRQYGKITTTPAVVTPTQGTALPTETIARDIDLNGRVTELDLSNGLAAISIGSAAGVDRKMQFHVTRGEEFVCDIVILDVEADKAVGDLKRIQMQPQVGDTVTTNL